MADVIFYEAFEEEEEAIRRLLPDHIAAEFTSKTIQECNDEKPAAGLVSIRTQSRIPESWVKSIDAVLTRSQGYDHLLGFCGKAGNKIPCGYLDNYCARAVAEQAVLMMMALLRKLKKQMDSLSVFSRDGLTGRECRGCNVFIAGVGNIGQEIADLTKGLRANVKGFDILQKLKNFSYVSLEEGITWADVVFCALPLTSETKGLFNYAALQKAKPGLIFINVARGEVSPVEDLEKLFDERILGGMALDVYPQESALAQYLRAGKTDEPISRTILKLAKMEQVIFTPHNAFNTKEALEQKASLSVEAVVQYLKNGTFPCSVPHT